jgi:Response regulator containing CheY-like receiver domain and AraC-type DNA-binding domain
MYNILLVEDEKQIREGIRLMIEKVIGGFRICAEAENGLAALEMLRNHAVDLLITDVRMPLMNGIELLRHVRGSHPDLPVLIISGYDEFAYAKEGMRYNASDYLLKPVDRIEVSQFLLGLKSRLDGERAREAAEPAAIGEDQTIRKVKELVLANLDKDISLQFMAEQVHLNHQYLSTLFKVKTGQNYSDFVTSCRMNHAKDLLVQTQLKVYEVAKLCGYSSHNHFSNVFREYWGATPTEFRQQRG